MLPIIYCLVIALNLATGCLMIALDAHMFIHNEYVPRKGPRPKELWAVTWRTQLLGAWACVLGPYPLWLNISASRAIDSYVINIQFIVVNTWKVVC